MPNELTATDQPVEKLTSDSHLAWITAAVGLASIAAAAIVNLVVEGVRPQPETLSSEVGAAAFARLFLTLGGMLAVGAAVSLRPNRVGMLALAFVAALPPR